MALGIHLLADTRRETGEKKKETKKKRKRGREGRREESREKRKKEDILTYVSLPTIKHFLSISSFL